MSNFPFPVLRPLQRWAARFTATPEEINTVADGITATAAEVNAVADLSAAGAISKVVKIPISATPDGSEEDSGFDIPLKSIVKNVWLDVTVAEATGGTKTMDVGLDSGEAGGDADGFLVGVDVSAVGIIKGTLLNTGQTLGAFLAVDEGGTGELVPEPHVCNGTAVSVSYTAGSADWVEFEGDIYIEYVEVA